MLTALYRRRCITDIAAPPLSQSFDIENGPGEVSGSVRPPGRNWELWREKETERDREDPKGGLQHAYRCKPR